MGLLMKALSAIGGQQRTTKGLLIQSLNFSRHRVNAFGAKEKSVHWPVRRPLKRNVPVEFRVRLTRFKLHVFAAALWIKPKFDCNRLQQCAFTDAVLADEKCDRWVQVQALEFLQYRNAKRKGFPIADFFPV